MHHAERQRRIVRGASLVFALMLVESGLFGQVGFLLRDRTHVCACPIDGDHHCDCPACAGLHVAGLTEPDRGPTNDPASMHGEPCGAELGTAPPWVAMRALVPEQPQEEPVVAPGFDPPVLEPPARSSLDPHAPETPPPRRA